uniref:Uncharacterized protein n=1 Tax=Tanacetum cinerariifolium TaxID=118510 RepID=A0A699JIX3_TANCI|nr:hypothetical protein [Tanacetum cinerariifolium]
MAPSKRCKKLLGSPFRRKNQHGKGFSVHLGKDIPQSGEQKASQTLLDLKNDPQGTDSGTRAYLAMRTWVAYGREVKEGHEGWPSSFLSKWVAKSGGRGSGGKHGSSCKWSFSGIDVGYVRWCQETRWWCRFSSVGHAEKVGEVVWRLSDLVWTGLIVTGPTDNATDCANMDTIRPYSKGFGAFAWRIPIFVTVLKTILRHSKLFEGFKVQLGEDPIQARRGGIRARGEGTSSPVMSKYDMNAHVYDLIEVDLGILVKTYRIPLDLTPVCLTLSLLWTISLMTP